MKQHEYKVVDYVHRFASLMENEFTETASWADLETLVEEYVKAYESISFIETNIRHTLSSTIEKLREILIEKIVKQSDRVPFSKLIEYAEKALVLGEVLEKLSENTVINNLRTLGLDQLLLVSDRSLMYGGLAFEEIIKRLKTAPCEVAQHYINKIPLSLVNKKRKKLLFNSLITRLECPNVLTQLLCDRFWTGEYKDDELRELIKSVVSIAVKDFDNISCRGHLSLLYGIAEVKRYILLVSAQSEMESLLREYAQRIIENFERCSVMDLEHDLLKAEYPLYWYVSDKRKYAEAAARVLARDIEAISATDAAKVLDRLFELDKKSGCLILKRIGFSSLIQKTRLAMQSFLEKGISEVGNLAFAVSISRIIDECREQAVAGVKTELSNFCEDIKRVVETLTSIVVNPTGALELVHSVYWLHKLKGSYVEWCGHSVEIPVVDLEKASTVIWRDLEAGRDPYKLRNAIKSLAEVDEDLSESLMRRFDKHRKKLGIVFGERWKKCNERRTSLLP